MDVWELTTREEIRELVASYAHFADSGRFDEMVALFAEDGVLEIVDREELHGRQSIHDFLVATAARFRESSAPRSMRHHVTSLRIEVSAPGEATSASYFLVVGDHGPDHWGRYRDRYTHRDGRWLFARRRVRVDGRAPSSAIAHRDDRLKS
jgi:ketosteroid isomerase-like protein